MDNNLTLKQIIIVICMFIGIPILITMFFISSNSSINNSILYQTTSGIKFELLESNSRRDDNLYIISGKVKQTEKENYQGIFIEFTLYDENNNKVRDTTTNFCNYLGNSIWEFEAHGNDADKIVVYYKLKNVYEFK